MVQANQRILRTRSKKASTLGLVAMCAFLIIIALAGAFQLMVYLGTSQELKNSVDAASLNVAMRATDIKVPDRPEFGFDDVGDCTGKLGLSNINRVWAKAYLVAANADEINNQGQSNGFVEKSVETSYGNAMTLNNSLESVLQNGAAQDVAFNQMTSAKPAKLLKANGDVTSNHDDQWSTACLYRGEESNIKIDPTALPQNATPATIKMNNNVWLQGYNGMQAHGKTFCLTTFHSNEAPHLVSLATFDQWKNSPVNGAHALPIPNTFKQAGSINGQVSLNASAVAVANPMLSYHLQFPRAYVMLAFQNSANWFVQGAMYKHTLYSPSTGKTWVVKSKPLVPPAKGILNGYATLGNEYKGDVYSAINALPGDHSQAISKLLQRLKEMRPNFTQTQLITLLKGIQYPPNASTLYVMIYCDDNCSTAVQSNLPPPKYCEIYTDDQGNTQYVNLPSFIPSRPDLQAEGNEKMLFNENPLVDTPNYCWSNIIGPYPTDKHSLTESGVVSWKPGTGWTGCLGMIRISRTANINFTGLP
ncbi:MAG TPA: hypothetical protein V6C76_14140 [Drouetiella sp.]